MNQKQMINAMDMAAQRRNSFSRRRFLRGVGAAVALPALESLLPVRLVRAAYADAAPAANLATTATGMPLRMAFVYFPNGAIPSTWWPDKPGNDFAINKTMEPLKELKDKFQVLGGLDCLEATPGPDGGGDHARAGGSFLTGVRVKKTSTDIRAGVSIDQVAAQQVGHLTPFPSLELSCDAVRTTGNCDSGYSCAYTYNLAWRGPSNPITPEPNPRQLFERMFGSGPQGERKENLARRMAQEKSILDFVMDDARGADQSLVPRDKIKLDEYLTSLRAIERRIEKAERFRDEMVDPNVDTPIGVPGDYGEHIQLMFDMLVLALQTDQTRIATFLMAYEGSNRTLPFLGFPEGHHTCTHHNNREELVEKTKIIDLWYVQQFAKFLHKMEQVQDLDGNSLLHNSMICYGSGHSDGNRHLHSNLPVILAGSGGGTLTPGRYVRFDDKPITNLYLSLLDRLGCQGVKSHGDSTGRVEDI